MRIFRILFLAFIVILISALNVCAEDWKPYSKDSEGYLGFLYDADSVKHISKNVVQVWTKMIIFNKEAEIKRQKERGYYQHGISDRLSHGVSLTQINCKTTQIKNIKESYYDNLGNVLKSEQNIGAKWKAISPGSTTSFLFKIVCKEKTK